MRSGYEQIYLDLIPRLSQSDLKGAAERLGLAVLSNGDVSVKFCGREFLINPLGVYPADGEPAGVNDRSVLAYYILSKGQGAPECSYLPLRRMTGMIDGRKLHDKELMVKPLLAEFGDDYDKFQCAAHKLGGIPESDVKDGGHCWNFQVLPKIPVRLVYYEADDEFPADIQLLFDRSAPRFLEFECLAFLSGCFVRALLMAARNATAVDKAVYK